MTLRFYYHPLASYCHKVLIALYENRTAFEPHIVDLGDERSRSDFLSLWPMGKMPVLHDLALQRVMPESSIIIEYLANHYPGDTKLIPDEPNLALETRLADRFYDLYVHGPMQAIVADRIRPVGKGDPYGLDLAQKQLLTAYGVIDAEMTSKTWAAGETFTLADCAAAPALFYGNEVMPFAAYPNVVAYFSRLRARPSYARVLAEAEPYFAMFPRS